MVRRIQSLLVFLKCTHIIKSEILMGINTHLLEHQIENTITKAAQAAVVVTTTSRIYAYSCN